jgi:glycine/D-amino acid oxidase-like deaminating enzyme
VTRRVVVVGAGIVGTAVAERLGVRGGCEVVVLDRAPRGQLRGSTGHAPGFVGLVGEDSELARRSVEVYRELSAFEPVGAVELAETSGGAEALATRADAAVEAGIPASLLDPAEAARLAPRLVDPARVEAALHLPLDGAARADVVTAALRERAEAAGVRFVPRAKVTEIDLGGDRVVAVRAGSRSFAADDVVLACGIWGPTVAELAGVDLPLAVVAHPYVYGPRRPRPNAPSPLVRWSERQIYARDDGDRDGLGTSNHEPLVVAEPPERAELEWPDGGLEAAVAAATELWPAEHRWRPAERVCGLLSITPDRRPLLGPFGAIGGLWAAEAIWVTHAAGAAEALVATMYGEPSAINALRPDRFGDEPADELRARAAERYRDPTAAVAR